MDDLAVPQHHRSGAHRARRHPLLVALVTLGAVGLASAVLLWGLLTFDVLGVGDDLREAGGSLVPSTAPVDPSASAAPSADPGAGPGVGPSVDPTAEPSTDPKAEPSTEPSPEPSPEPSADRSLPVDVLNSTATPGLAAGAAEALEGLGWTIGEVTNFEGDEIDTVVLYPDAEQQVTAEAVAQDLGAGSAQQSDEVDVLTVVLGPDYTG